MVHTSADKEYGKQCKQLLVQCYCPDQLALLHHGSIFWDMLYAISFLHPQQKTKKLLNLGVMVHTRRNGQPAGPDRSMLQFERDHVVSAHTVSWIPI